MKRFSELSHEKIKNLTTENVQFYVDLECAHKSIPLLPSFPLEPKKPDIKSDITLYRVGDFRFDSFETAKKVLECLIKSPLYGADWTGMDFVRYTAKKLTSEDYNYPNISQEASYTQATFNMYKEEIETYNNLKKLYDKQKKEYEEVYAKRKVIEKTIEEKIVCVNSIEQTKKRYKIIFDRYLSLAEGDREIAAKFFDDAHPEHVDEPELYRFIEQLYEEVPPMDR